MILTIRPYTAEDRQALRDICCDVANKGEPIDEFFPDREVTADFLTSYYTDYEPQSTFIAQYDGKIVGYINGCLDNRRYGLVIFFLILPVLFIKAIVRGTFLDKKVKQSLALMMKNWQRLVGWRKTSFNSHSAHVHIGILKEYRHMHLGTYLVEHMMKHAKGHHIAVLTASVHSFNVAGSKFFEKHGFVLKAHYPMNWIYQGHQESYQSLYYVKELS